MIKAIFWDRDGTLNKDDGYVHKIKDFELYPDVLESLAMLKYFKFFIVTNQSGISRGKYSEEDFKVFNNHLVGELSKNGIEIVRTYHCPHHPELNCDCRKPNPKFVIRAKDEFDIELSKSWVVGDHPQDIQLGKNCGCKTIYLLTGHGPKHKMELEVEPDFIANNLTEAANFIIENDK